MNEEYVPMIVHSQHDASCPIAPLELEMLQRVFDHQCELRSIEPSSVDAENLAALVVSLYQHGVRQEPQLGLALGRGAA